MNACSPEEMKKNLEVVDTFKKHGIDFVPVPVLDSDHKKTLIAESHEIFRQMLFNK